MNWAIVAAWVLLHTLQCVLMGCGAALWPGCFVAACGGRDCDLYVAKSNDVLHLLE